MSTELARRNGDDLPSPQVAESITQALEGLRAIRTFIKQEFVEGIHFGKIKGCCDKPTLFLPGAQAAAMYFNCYPTYKVREKDLGEGHVSFRVRCLLISRVTGRQIGEGIGCASTRERKFQRGAGGASKTRKCPHCGKDTVFRSKKEGEGFYCWRKEGGCGVTFPPNHPDMRTSAVAESANEAPYESHNTVLKMAKKRAQVDASITLGCLSELFTQDIEDTYSMGDVRQAAPREEPEPYHVDGEVVEPPPPPQKSAAGLFTKAHIEQTKAFNDWVARKCKATNDAWVEDWEDRIAMALDNGLAAPAKVEDVINPWQAKAHLLKWAIEAGRLADVKAEATRTRQTDAYVAEVFYRSDEDKAALKEEMGEYVHEQRRLKSDAIYRKNPDLAPDGWAEEQAEAADRGDAYEGDLAESYDSPDPAEAGKGA